MTLRMFVGALGAEVNTFSDLPITRTSFDEVWMYAAGEIPRSAAPPLVGAPLRRAWDLENEGVVTVTQGLCAVAQPAGRVVQSDYEGLRDELLNDIASAGPLDIVVLKLHGAMAAERCDDCEGDLLERLRSVIGRDASLGVLLDPHCHLTTKMLEAADLVIAYKEYPHDDIMEMADKIVDLSVLHAQGAIRPVTRAWDCRTIGIFNTYREPMRTLVDDLNAETNAREDILDISIAHGFPWGDVADMGSRVWVTTNDDPAEAAQTAERYGRRMEAEREANKPHHLSIDDAVAAAATGPYPLVLAETADNPGGGAPGDATHLVQALLKAGLSGIVGGLFADPAAVEKCVAAGVGGEVSLSVGGRSPLSGSPLQLDVRVVGIIEDLEQPYGGSVWPTGRAVCVENDDVLLVISVTRCQCFAMEAFTAFGVDLTKKRVIAVKSSNHFESSFRKLTGRIAGVATPGVVSPDYATLPYAKLQRPIWPIDGDVHGFEIAF